MSMKLPKEDIKFFQVNGAICIRQAFEPEWIKKITVGIEKNLSNPSPHSKILYNEDSQLTTTSGQKNSSAFFQDFLNWRQIPEFKDFIWNSPAVNIVGQLLNSTYIAIHSDHVLVKEPGSTRITPWHSDQSYFPIDGNKVCSIWLPIDPVSYETSLKFVAGSHLWPKLFVPKNFSTAEEYQVVDNDSDMAILPNDEELEQGKHDILQWELQPGDCVVFHMKTLHSASGNNSEVMRRRILSTRWLGDDAIYASRPWNAISPPTYSELKYGNKLACKELPIVWERN